MERSPREGLPEYGIDRVVGNAPDEMMRKTVLEIKEFAEKHDALDDSEKQFEVASSPEEREDYLNALAMVNELRKIYGKEPLQLDIHNLHILEFPENSTTQWRGTALTKERHLWVTRVPSRLLMLHDLVHELAHLGGYNVIQHDSFTETNEATAGNYRFGTSIYSRNSVLGEDKTNERTAYFRNLNEALTEEIAIQLTQQYEQSKFQDEIHVIEEFKKWATSTENSNVENIDEILTVLELPNGVDRIYYRGYISARSIYQTLFQKISEANPNVFPSPEEVRRLFVDAQMTGNILPIGRLIDKTYGKGTFRTIGEKDVNLENLREYVDNLTPLEISTQDITI